MSPFDTAVLAAPIFFIIAILLGLSGMAETVVTCLARFSLVQAIIAAEAGLMKGILPPLWPSKTLGPLRALSERDH